MGIEDRTTALPVQCVNLSHKVLIDLITTKVLLLITHMLGDLNGRTISLVEVREAVNEMKSGKAPGLDGLTIECLKKGGMAVLEWLFILLNVFLIWGLYLWSGVVHA